MFEAAPGARNKVLAFSAIVEAITGLALLIDPALVVAWLLGAGGAGQSTLLGRCFGIALLALATACRPGAGTGGSAVQGLLVYNALIALFLAYLGAVELFSGWLLWPAVALHAVVALALAWFWRRTTRA